MNNHIGYIYQNADGRFVSVNIRGRRSSNWYDTRLNTDNNNTYTITVNDIPYNGSISIVHLRDFMPDREPSAPFAPGEADTRTRYRYIKVSEYSNNQTLINTETDAMEMEVHHNSHHRTVPYTVITKFNNLITNGIFKLEKNPTNMLTGSLQESYFIGSVIGEYPNRAHLVDNYSTLEDVRGDKIDQFDNIKD